MAENRGKQFEGIVRDAFEDVPGVSIDRFYDQTTGFKGSQNICDFVVYRKPNELYMECKSCHGNTFPFSNITDTQYSGLLKKSVIKGVIAGVLIWWVDRDTTKFIPISKIEEWKLNGLKSVRYDTEDGIVVPGRKKRVFFEYDMKAFLDEVQNGKTE